MHHVVPVYNLLNVTFIYCFREKKTLLNLLQSIEFYCYKISFFLSLCLVLHSCTTVI